MKHRSYVGPIEGWDLIAAMTFNLLTQKAGMRQHHKVLDIGCGSLRVGRLLIQYLNTGNYHGIEPNKWLIDDAIHEEVGADLIRIKNPAFVYDDSSCGRRLPTRNYDFIFAQSIFSHSGQDIINQWLSVVKRVLKEFGEFYFTYIECAEPCRKTDGFNIRRVNKYTYEEITGMCAANGFNFAPVGVVHPFGQSWMKAVREQR